MSGKQLLRNSITSCGQLLWRQKHLAASRFWDMRTVLMSDLFGPTVRHEFEWQDFLEGLDETGKDTQEVHVEDGLTR